MPPIVGNTERRNSRMRFSEPEVALRRQTLYPTELRGALLATTSLYSGCTLRRNGQPTRFVLTVPNFVTTQARNRVQNCILGWVDVPGRDSDRAMPGDSR